MKQKTVIITGGSDGIGRETALAFAENNSLVLITGRNASKLQEVVGLHKNINYLVADSSVPENAEIIIDKAISLWGKLDILVNNVGAGLTSTLENTTVEQIKKILDVNIIGTTMLTKLSVPHLRKTNGTVINVSSVVSNMVLPGISQYGASKAAIDYLTKAWAVELAPDIRVNAVAPGPTKSGALTGMMGLSEEVAKKVEAQEASEVPLQRRGIPEDISRWILLLADENSSWITGQIISVDGGWGLR